MSVVEIIKKKFVLVSGAAVVFVGFGLAGYYSYGGDKKKTQVQASLATASFMTSRGGKKTDTMYSAAASLRTKASKTKASKKSRSQIDSKSGKGGNGEICLERGEIFVVEGLTSPITGPADIFNPPCGSMNPEPENCTYFYEPFFMQNGGSESSFVFTDEIGGGELCGGKTDSAAARDKFSFIYVGMEDGELYDAFICSSCFSYGRPSPSALDGKSGTQDLSDLPLGDLKSLSYNFYVDSCPSSAGSCPEQFYVNVYLRQNSDRPNFYDCNMAFSAAGGGIAGGNYTSVTVTPWTQLSSEPTNTGGGPGCEGMTSLSEYLQMYPGAVLGQGGENSARAPFQFNVGDSAVSTNGIYGCFDRVRIGLDDEATRVYNFVPEMV